MNLGSSVSFHTADMKPCLLLRNPMTSEGFDLSSAHILFLIHEAHLIFLNFSHEFFVLNVFRCGTVPDLWPVIIKTCCVLPVSPSAP